MRVPLTQLHRAFREFDQLTDDECKAYINRMRRISGKGWMLTLLPILTFLVAVPVFFFVSAVPLYLWENLHDMDIVWLRYFDRHGGMQVVIIVISLILFFGGPLFSALLVRDLLFHQFLSGFVRNKLIKSMCPKCGYSLIGLPIRDGKVSCSECGQIETLISLGLSEEDLKPPMQA